MNIQITTDANIDGNEDLRRHVEELVTGSLERFGDRVTRVEVFLSDESSSAKSRNDDKRCVLEARLAGLRPIAVTHRTGNVHQAIDGAVEKLEKTLDRTLGRLKDVRNHIMDASTEEP
jgi:ribosomal subunit interface protein